MFALHIIAIVLAGALTLFDGLAWIGGRSSKDDALAVGLAMLHLPVLIFLIVVAALSL